MTENPSKTMSLSEVARRTNVPARTIRYYIAQRLIDGPLSSGRGAAYDGRHLQQLQEVLQMKEKGLSLSEIRLQRGALREGRMPAPEQWWSYRVAEDCRVEIRSDTSPWRIRRIHRLLEQVSKLLSQEGKEDEDA